MRIQKTRGRHEGRRRGEFAFTLVEVLIAGFILGLTIVAVYGAFSFGFSVVRVNQENVRADQLLVERLETLRLYSWYSVTNGYFTSFTNSFAPGASAQGVTYTGSISISNAPVTESYGNSLRAVTVGLSWVSGGITRQRTMTTFVSQYGIANFKP